MYTFVDLCNHVMIMAIAGLLLAGLSKELYNAYGDFIAFIVRHATFLSIMQQFTSLHTEISRDHISHSSTSFESKTLCKVDTAPKLPFSNDITTSGDDHFLEVSWLYLLFERTCGYRRKFIRLVEITYFTMLINESLSHDHHIHLFFKILFFNVHLDFFARSLIE